MPDWTWMHSVFCIWLCCVVMRIGYRIHLHIAVYSPYELGILFTELLCCSLRYRIHDSVHIGQTYSFSDRYIYRRIKWYHIMKYVHSSYF